MRQCKKLTALLLAVVVILSLMPTSVFALEPALTEGRSTNAVEYAGIKFWETYNNGHSGWFEVPRDVASKRIMYCVDPGKGSATDYSKYSVSLATGENVESLIGIARSQAMLKNAGQDSVTSEEMDDFDWETVLDADVLNTLDTSTFQTIIEMMSVLHIKFDKTGTYNTYDVYAVQNFIWHVCNPNSKGMWYKVEQDLTEAEAQKVKNSYAWILEEVYNLYHAGVPAFIATTDTGSIARTQTTLEAAISKPLNLHSNGEEVVEKSLSVSDKQIESFNKNIKYVAIDGNVQSFSIGDTAVSADGLFSITRTESGFDLKVEMSEDGATPDYAIMFLKTDSIPNEDSSAYDNEDWAIFAQAPARKQCFFTAYKAPTFNGVYLAVRADTEADSDVPVFPYFQFDIHKYDEYGWFDSDTCTPAGGSELNAVFTVSWATDMGDSGSISTSADLYGHGASAVVYPWDGEQDPKSIVHYEEVTSTYTEGEGEEATEIEFVSEMIYSGTATITVEETGAPLGHHLDPRTYTHEVTYYASASREDPYSDFTPFEYTITLDGQTYNMTGQEVLATEDTPINSGDEDVFINTVFTGSLQIIKEIGSDDIFSQEEGKGTVAGGAVSGKEYSTDSLWTMRIVDEDIMVSMTAEEAAAFEGYENCPYVKVRRDTSHSMNTLMNVYQVMNDGSGTPADPSNPLTVSEFGQMFIYNIPYGTYLISEISADADRYVLESFYVYIPEDNYVHSTDVINTDKRNIVEVVKVDEETGKTIPSAKTAFRIRYLGSPEYADPTQTPGYGRYLPNASNINASVTSAEDYIFYTDPMGKITIDYELPYGSYQLEELVVPEHYFIGAYDTDGEAETVDGNKTYIQKVAVYDENGNHIDYTKDEDIVYNYFPFEVTEQADHMDGEDYEPYYLTVTMPNSQVKGKVEISKLGERLVGFREVEQDGFTVFEPVFESFPLEGATFDIFAAEDVLLEDGEDPPKAYDKLTGEEIRLITDVLTHAQFPDMEIIQSGTHEGSGAEVIHTYPRDISESNVNTVEYLTPIQKGTTYSLNFSNHVDGLTYDYEVTFGFEYSAGGWNYTDIHVRRTITADDYLPYIDDTMPVIKNGGEVVTCDSSAVYANGNKLEVKAETVNEYDMSAIRVVPQSFTRSRVLTPEIADSTNPDLINNLPEIPAGYSLHSVSDTRFLIVNDQFLNDIRVAVVIPPEDGGEENPDAGAGDNPDDTPEEPVIEWQPRDTADPALYLMPTYKQEAVFNLPELPAGATFLYATQTRVFVQVGEDIKVLYTDDEGNITCQNVDGTGLEQFVPDNIPEGYEYVEATGIILAERLDEESGDYLYKCYVYDPDLDTYRWVDSDSEGNIYKVRVQELDVMLTQHNESNDGWYFEMDGILLSNVATNEDTATAVITNPFNVEPVIADSVGCDIATVPMADGGNQTTIVIKHPSAPVYFDMIDGTKVEMVYLGGFSKTTLQVPATAELPVIYYRNVEIDYFDWANGGLTPDHNHNEVVFDEYNYVRVTRYEASDVIPLTYYQIEVVSSAAEEREAFLIDYDGAYESVSLVVPDAVTGVQRGNLQFRAIYKTMRYPLSSLVERITSGPDGVATSSLLPLGDYIIRESSVVDGFVATNQAFPFSLTYENQYTPLIWRSAEIGNGAMSVQLDLYKEFQKALGSDEYEPRAGAIFGVYAYNPIAANYTAADGATVTTASIPADTLVATLTVDEFGKAVETIKLPIGDYYVKELQTLPGYSLNDTRFIFRVDEETKADGLKFTYENLGVSGKVSHTGYKMAEVEIVTLTQIPPLSMTVNGVKYDTTEALDAETLGSGVLVQNTVDADRSTFVITVVMGQPATITFANGSSMELTVEQNTYTAIFTDGDEAVSLDTGVGKNISTSDNEDGSTSVIYNPYVAYTGYVAETTSMYREITTQARAEDGTTAMFLADRASGSKKVVITYDKTKYSYYHELPVKQVEDDENPGQMLDVPYIPDGAIIFGTDADPQAIISNTSHVVPEGWLIDLDKGEIIIDLSVATVRDVRFGAKTAEAGTLSFTGASWTAPNDTNMSLSYSDGVKNVCTDGNTVLADGTQIDWVTTATTDTSASHNWVAKQLSLSAVGGSAEVDVALAHDHTYGTLNVLQGTVTSAWVNGESKDVSTLSNLPVLPSYEVILLMSDSTIYRVDLSNNGCLTMSAEGIISGAIGDSNKPMLKVNGSADNFLNVDYQVITQAMPMDETSYNDIRQYNTQSVTLARSDSWVKQLQVKINASSDINAGIPDGGIEGEGSGTNPIYNDVRPYILKTDVTGAKLLAGAKIEIYDVDGNVYASGYSGSDGRFYFDLPSPGKFTFREIYAPSGYLVNEEVFEFIVHPDGSITGDNTIKDERIPDRPDNPGPGPGPSTPKVTLNKLDSVTMTGIPGVELEVWNEDKTELIASGKTSVQGKFTFDRPKNGVYWFRESATVEPYELNENWYTFTVAGGRVTGDDTILNDRKPVYINKTNVTNAEGVPGAYIEVLDENHNVIASGYSNEAGLFEFERPNPGKFYFHEVVAPKGFILNEEFFSFTVNEDLSITGDLTITNVPNTIIIEKVESGTGRPLEGATIELWDEEGKLVEVGVTGPDGLVYFAAPKLGTFIYRESISPEGYILDEGTHVITLHADGTITGELRLTNTPYIPRTGLTDWTPVLLCAAGVMALALAVTLICVRKSKRR
ncbi:MAG: hypothetical protein IJA20_03720 [Methanocorpusculum sp.]|nr:hypothetical protein [Methanocorpusculum sp.]